METPGGSSFTDVTHVFEDASKEMELGELIMADGFTLNDAMCAVEIGDPRMDSGALLPQSESELTAPSFDPLMPLLPEEICWILDRALACEMHWHAGNALGQTVYTCLFVHCLDELDPGRTLPSLSPSGSTNIALRLTTLILRTGIIGLLKCCDLAYRELVKGNVHDCEDWQGEKSDVFLCETVQTQIAIDLLIDARTWLESEEAKDVPYKEDLIYRIQLRKALLSLYKLELPRKAAFISPIASDIRHLMSTIKRRPLPQLRANSPAYSAFDPHIARQLRSIMPMRAIDIPSSSNTWAAVEGLIGGFDLIAKLSNSESLLAWNTIGQVHARHPRYKPLRAPFIRSLTQSIFSNGTTILERFPLNWLVDRFFLETADIAPSTLTSLFEECPWTTAYQEYDEFQTHLLRFILQHIWCAYHNRPRQRRHYMKASLDWHVIYDRCVKLLSNIEPRDALEHRVIKSMPLAIQHWRATVIQDIIFSGFELELFMADERPFAYWYLARVLGSHGSILTALMCLTPEDSQAHSYLSWQKQYVLALKNISHGCFLLTSTRSPFDAARRWTNFAVRYKWALRREFESIETPDPFLPDFYTYLRHERQLLNSRKKNQVKKRRTDDDNAAVHFENALRHLLELGQNVAQQSGMAFELCSEEFTHHHLANLTLICENLKNGTLAAAAASDSTSRYIAGKVDTDDDAALRSRLHWDAALCAWFPIILTQR